jgi:hypothetical protein
MTYARSLEAPMMPIYIHTLQAKWLSAFCAFTGLELHPKKIKPTIVGPVRKNHLKHLKVYNHQWELINCPILLELDISTWVFNWTYKTSLSSPSIGF